MSFTRVSLTNYRSIREGQVRLCPFSLVIGPNGAGKSGFLEFFRTVLNFNPRETISLGPDRSGHPFDPPHAWRRHLNHPEEKGSFCLDWEDETGAQRKFTGTDEGLDLQPDYPWTPGTMEVFGLDPRAVIRGHPEGGDGVAPNGKGLPDLLLTLAESPGQKQFSLVERFLQKCVPEVENLIVRRQDDGRVALGVKESGLRDVVPGHFLSEGTRLILGMLTILLQENPPRMVIFEDVDRGMHPRLFERFAEVMENLAEDRGINLLASTHNPYLVDCFYSRQEALLVVEKNNGVSTLANLDERIAEFTYDQKTAREMPLGSLWFSGLVGGVPESERRKK